MCTSQCDCHEQYMCPTELLFIAAIDWDHSNKDPHTTAMIAHMTMALLVTSEPFKCSCHLCAMHGEAHLWTQVVLVHAWSSEGGLSWDYVGITKKAPKPAAYLKRLPLSLSKTRLPLQKIYISQQVYCRLCTLCTRTQWAKLELHNSCTYGTYKKKGRPAASAHEC